VSLVALTPGPLVAGDGRTAPQPRVGGVRLDDLVGARFAVIARTPELFDHADNFWKTHAARLDAQTYPELAALLDDFGADVIVLRPDRYVLAAGPALAACPGVIHHVG
jgi:hypothetical protein